MNRGLLTSNVLRTVLLVTACGACAATTPPLSPTNAAASPAGAASALAAPYAASGGGDAAVDDVVIPPYVATAVAASDRDEKDKALDAGRHPAALLAFCGVQPGGRVAEISATGGYTAELLARVVGPQGKVYGQNAKAMLERFAEKPWSARLAKPVNANIVRVDREFDDPLPPEATGLDVVVDNLFYHDTVWLNVDRDKMNKAILAALKPGGVYCIIDHSAKRGTGTADVKKLHRIDQAVVESEVEKAGFKLAAASKVWRNDSDTRDWNASPMAAKEKRGTSDRFALKFVRP